MTNALAQDSLSPARSDESTSSHLNGASPAQPAVPAPGAQPAAPAASAQAAGDAQTAPQRTAPRAGEIAPDVSAAPTLRADSSVTEAIAGFDEYMLRKGFSENTIKAFDNDLKIIAGFLGPETRLAQIGTSDLEQFLHWMQYERGKPCSAKTLARRITTLKVFFGWLHGVGVIGTDPSEPVVQQPARPPLPEILRDDEINKLLSVSRDMLWDRLKPDARPYLLVSLLVQTGMKKAEVSRLLLADLDAGQPNAPEVTIRYADEAHAHKNRTLGLHPSILPVLNQYKEQYKPAEFLFDCTPRNLEYVLEEVGDRAGIRRLQVGFESLRWTAAVRDYRMGMPEERLRQKMGLSKISWRETREKIHKLAGH